MRAGRIYKADRTIVEKIAQNSATLTAPTVNPRNDIVCIDATTGTISVIAGAEAASPVDPAITANKLPKARIRWTVGMAQIANSVLDDLRFDAPSLDAIFNYLSATPLPLTHGGTGANSAAGARSNIGAETAGAAAAVQAAAVMDGDAAAGALGGTYPSPSLANVATQANAEAETAGKIIVAEIAKYLPGMAKAWVRFDVSGGTPSIVASYNVTSITDNGLGDFTINFTTAFSSANYVGVITCSGSTTSGSDSNFAASLKGTPPTASAFRFGCYRSNVGDTTDPDTVFAVFYGDR
jgi:hypothetical protein